MSAIELLACPHCSGRPAFQMVPEGDPGGFGGRRYIECTNKRCGASTSLAPSDLNEAQALEFLRLRWNARADGSAPTKMPPAFPTALRKMWSGQEVQDWINLNWGAP